jgi:hypothetical protein
MLKKDAGECRTLTTLVSTTSMALRTTFKTSMSKRYSGRPEVINLSETNLINISYNLVYTLLVLIKNLIKNP